ncbi:MAG: hypothetical protein ED556_12225 [Winogradskyella sp.]|uniref:hypothetical protein n=1 Tax=Winogradskyella sp. TaxID=1883156 RepID=UPI000F4198AA|nr:hypothetical protein [Winogradskyella sp.]RNC84215.1 MAG: hypothetical protein ED556_12225 [Winogradskyella sp.]
MKTTVLKLFAVLAFIATGTTFAQSNISGSVVEVEKEVKTTDIKIEVEVDSQEELESTFTIEDIQELIDETGAGEDLSFSIKCNGEEMTNGLKASMTYEIKGNTDDRENFIKSIKKLRKAAIKYYQSKN